MPPKFLTQPAPPRHSKCNKCGQFKPNTDFQPTRRAKPLIRCLACRQVANASDDLRNAPAESSAIGAARSAPLAPRPVVQSMEIASSRRTSNIPTLMHRESSIATGTPQTILGSLIPDTKVTVSLI